MLEVKWIEVSKESIEFEVASKRLAKRLLLDAKAGEEVVRIYRTDQPCRRTKDTYNYKCLYSEYNEEIEAHFIEGTNIYYSLRGMSKYF
jgi:hypothetical protein